MSTSWLIILVIYLAMVSCRSLTGDRVLVLLDDLHIRDTHSLFLSDLQERGYKLDYYKYDSDSVVLSKYGDNMYDHVVVFAPSASSFGSQLDVGQLIDFIDDGGNMIVAASSGVEGAIQEIAKECGVHFGDTNSELVDHFHFDQSDVDGQHTLIISDQVNQDAVAVFGRKPTFAPILFRGVGHDIDDDHNPLLFRLLSAHSTSYSADIDEPLKTEPHVYGKRTTLVSALQARNNARVVFSGSLELFSNRFFLSSVKENAGKKSDKSGNREFAAELTKWAFKERSVLRASKPIHHRAGEKSPPKVYRINDTIEYHVDIHQWNGDKWIAYAASDVQLEFVRLDPHVRVNLQNDGNGHFHTQFIAPDVYGIFTFRVDYQRLGYTNILLADVVSVRPFRHDEYERFIPAAFPYYAGSFSMLIGLFLFSVVFLYHRESPQKRE